jgi:succinate dehydrogenase / fumarate reductase cytochrome b subunit
MNKKRPVNLDLRTIKLPLPALISFLHRVSGVALFLFLILMLYTFGKSLGSEEGFNEIKGILFSPIGKVSTWVVYSAFIYHLVAGIRHLIMDFGIGHTIEGGKRGSIAVIVVSGLLMAIGALWIW